jgi:hypothetical protein
MVRPAGEEGAPFFKNRTDAQDRCRPDNQCLVFWESLFVTMILEHYQHLLLNAYY